LKKEGKLTATESWEMNWQNSEVVDKFNYRGVMLGSTVGWNKHQLNWRISSTCCYRQMYISNPQYKGTGIRAQVWNVIWIED